MNRLEASKALARQRLEARRIAFDHVRALRREDHGKFAAPGNFRHPVH